MGNCEGCIYCNYSVNGHYCMLGKGIEVEQDPSRLTCNDWTQVPGK